MKSETIRLYPGREDVTLTTYVLEDSHELLNGRKRPAVIVCPGGAYLFCSDREGEAVALRFAAMGYHAFVLRYSVYNGGKMFDPKGEMKPDHNSIFPKAMLDLGAAMLLIRDRSQEWLVDEENIVISGFSAGAHNCAMYAVSWDGTLLQQHFGRPKESFRPAAAVLGYGFYDYYALRKEQQPNEMEERMNKAVNIALFGTEYPTDEAYKSASPVLHISKHTPPMYLWATAEDNVLPVQQTLMMAKALADQKIPFEVHVFENGNHGLVLADQSTAGFGGEIRKDVAKWVELAQCWLEKHVPVNVPKEPSMGNPFVE